MSIKLMAAAWELDIPPSEKMVLLCLCDHANDAGVCWPSVTTIARKCSKGERTIQGAIKWLREAGYCTWDETPGKPHRFALDHRKICSERAYEPPQKLRPAETAPPQKTTDTPAETADEPLRTINPQKATPSSVRRAKPQTTIADDFWPEVEPGSLTAKAMDAWPPGELEQQVEHFIDFHTAKDDTSKDWQASWRTWVKNWRTFNVGRNGLSQSRSGEGKTLGAIRGFVAGT